MNSFVPFNIAIKLTNIGFDLPEVEIYGKFDNDGVFHSQLYINFTETMDDEDIVAPTFGQVIDWFRRNKKINIFPNCIIKYREKEEGLIQEYEYYCEIYAPRMNKPYHTDYHTIYENVLVEAIEYVLNNLIC